MYMYTIKQFSTNLKGDFVRPVHQEVPCTSAHDASHPLAPSYIADHIVCIKGTKSSRKSDLETREVCLQKKDSQFRDDSQSAPGRP